MRLFRASVVWTLGVMPDAGSFIDRHYRVYRNGGRVSFISAALHTGVRRMSRTPDIADRAGHGECTGNSDTPRSGNGFSPEINPD